MHDLTLFENHGEVAVALPIPPSFSKRCADLEMFYACQQNPSALLMLCRGASHPGYFNLNAVDSRWPSFLRSVELKNEEKTV